MKKALVTGATGFVGANLARHLLREGCEIHLLLRPAYNPWRIESIRADVHLHVLDFDDRQALEREIGRIKPDWIFHLAAYGTEHEVDAPPSLAGSAMRGLRRQVDKARNAGVVVTPIAADTGPCDPVWREI